MKPEALTGRTIAGKYEIGSLVGQGAMGAVYKARQITLGTTLALKVLHRQLAGEPMFAARFLREAQAASRVDHPHSMRVVDFGEEPDGLLYIAMEFVDGKTLATIIEDEGPLPVARIVDIACQDWPRWPLRTTSASSIATSSPRTSWSSKARTTRDARTTS